MNSKNTALVLISALLLLSLLPVIQATHASVYGWATVWWDTSVWNNRFPGNTIYFDFELVNTGMISNGAGGTTNALANVTLSWLRLVTPWGNYTATGLPTGMANGDAYFYEFGTAIPSSQHTGDVDFTIYFTGTYSDGSAMCWDTSNVCSQDITLTIDPNPFLLQQQVTTLNGTVASLTSQVSSLQIQVGSLQSQLSAATGTIATLQTQTASLQGQVSTLQAQLAAAQNNASSLQAQLTAALADRSATQQKLQASDAQVQTLNGTLASTQAQLLQATATVATDAATLNNLQSSLTSTQASLAAKQSALDSYSSLYLPLAAGIPSVAAVILLVLYLRKHPTARTA